MPAKKISAVLLAALLSALPASFAFAQTAATASTSAAAAGQNSVGLLIEPQTYTPPFYKGAALFTDQSQAKVIALPNVSINGAAVDPKALTFTWSVNGTVLADQSGPGQNTFILNSGFPFRDPTIGVKVSDAAGDDLADDSEIVNLRSPEIVFYESSPLYGIVFNRALDTGFNMGTNEDLELVAKPFYFTASADDSSNLSYNWTVNGNAITISGKKNELLLHQGTAGAKGVTAVSLGISSVPDIFQTANVSLDVSFGQ